MGRFQLHLGDEHHKSPCGSIWAVQLTTPNGFLINIDLFNRDQQMDE